MPIIGYTNHADTATVTSTESTDAALVKDPRTDQMATFTYAGPSPFIFSIRLTWAAKVSISSMAVHFHTIPANATVQYSIYSTTSFLPIDLLADSGTQPAVAAYSAPDPAPPVYNQSLYTFTHFVAGQLVPKAYGACQAAEITFTLPEPFSVNVGYVWVGDDHFIQDPISGDRQSKRLATIAKGVSTFNGGMSAADSEHVKQLSFGLPNLTAEESNVMEYALDVAGVSKPVFFRPSLTGTPKDPLHEGGVVRFAQEFISESVDVRLGTEQDKYRIPAITVVSWR